MIWGRWGGLAILYSLLVICVPRIYLGYHYPSDVAAGALIGCLSALILGHQEDGTLVATRDVPPKEMLASLLASSDVLGTGWFGADAAAVAPGTPASAAPKLARGE